MQICVLTQIIDNSWIIAVCKQRKVSTAGGNDGEADSPKVGALTIIGDPTVFGSAMLGELPARDNPLGYGCWC